MENRCNGKKITFDTNKLCLLAANEQKKELVAKKTKKEGKPKVVETQLIYPVFILDHQQG